MTVTIVIITKKNKKVNRYILKTLKSLKRLEKYGIINRVDKKGGRIMKFNNRKIYKYTSIISLTIVIMLIGNLIAPILTTTADSGNGFGMTIQYNKEQNSLTLTGTLSSEYVGYNLYWAEGTMPYQKPGSEATNEEKIQYMDNVINWYTANSITDMYSSDSKQINSTINIPEVTADVTYSALCVARTADDSYAIAYVSKTLKAPVTIENTITIKLTADNKKISINVKDTNYDIKTIKIAKSDVPLKCADFSNVGENLSFTGTRDIQVSKDVESAGVYYIFAENTAGAQSVEGIVIKDVNDTENKIAIELRKEKDDAANTIYVKAVSSAGNITDIRYYISDQSFKFKDDQGNEITENTNLVKNSNNKLVVDGTKTTVVDEITNSDIDSDKYISIYVKATGYESYLIMPISSLGLAEGNPWGTTQPSNPGDESNPGEGSNPGDESTPGEPSNPDNEYEEVPEKGETGTIVTNPDENLPQTGTNDSIIIMAIIVFAVISLGSFIKYRNIK